MRGYLLHVAFFNLVWDQAYRKKREQRPNLPKSLDEVDIESYPDLTNTADGKPFYRGKTKSAAELFMSDIQMDIAASSQTIFMDGTFAICPFPFYQVVFFSAKVGDNVYPIATALLPNKLEATYKDVLQLIKDVFTENNKVFDPVYVHSDCEFAILNAVKAIFPNAQNRLCRFHVNDAIRRNGDSYALRPLIKTKKPLKDFYRRITQIFFFPINLWPRIWELVQKQLGDTINLPGVQSFIEYLVRQQQQQQ